VAAASVVAIASRPANPEHARTSPRGAPPAWSRRGPRGGPRPGRAAEGARPRRSIAPAVVPVPSRGGTRPSPGASRASAPPPRWSGPPDSRARPAPDIAPATGRSPRGVPGRSRTVPPSREPPPPRRAPRRSCARRRAASDLARTETRWATPWSQLATESALRTEPALRASTRNVAWKASWASCGSPRTAGRPGAPSARGDPRAPRAPPTGPSLAVRNRSSNCPSERSPTAPTWKSVSSPFRTSAPADLPRHAFGLLE
jgi:hypothetical protein